ncbi:MAG: ferritin-like domain-containing protein [Syntrophothermus sp.]
MKNENRKDTLSTWLKDAYAMEQGIVEILEKQISQFEDMPEAQMKIREHLELTKSQADRVRDCVERLGDDVSHVKSGMANVLGTVQGVSTAMANDKMVKNTMGNYAIEHFEIASYRVLVTAAREMGQENIAMVCEEIIREEQEMARWLEQALPLVTREHMRMVVRD